MDIPDEVVELVAIPLHGGPRIWSRLIEDEGLRQVLLDQVREGLEAAWPALERLAVRDAIKAGRVRPVAGFY